MANLAVLSLPSMMMRIEKLTYKLQSKINRFGGDKPLLLEANFMKNERIIDRQIKEAIEQSNPRSLGFSIKTVRFTKLISKVYTTHIFIIGRKKGGHLGNEKHRQAALGAPGEAWSLGRRC